MNKPRMLVLSHVLPFPGAAGQQRRVQYTLKAVRDYFQVTFLTSVSREQVKSVREQLSFFCDDAILLLDLNDRNRISKAWHLVNSGIYTLTTGLKRSNYLVGKIEYSPTRLTSMLKSWDFDIVLFEYWHAASSAKIFQARGIPCVVDIHNILWKNYSSLLNSPPIFPARWESALPKFWRNWAIARYRSQEEQAWKCFDGVLVMDPEEKKQVQSIVLDKVPIYFAPMGTDINAWPYSWQPASPPRIAYYGGLGNPYNQKDALTCFHQVMPAIWQKYPLAELWIVGSNPPETIRSLSAHPRVKVPGYVENVVDVLNTMMLVAIPWSGAHGFRSRLIEVMALGVPVVTTPEVISEMELEQDRGLILAGGNAELPGAVLYLLENFEICKQQSRLARAQVEEKYSFEATYGEMAKDLLDFTLRRMNNKDCEVAP